LTLVLELGSWPAHAAGADATASTGEAAPRPAPASAQELADRAYELHEAGNYAAAIATYLKAYEASNAAVTLFNIATIYDRKLHERQLAAEYYRRYLGAPDAEPQLVQKATERLTALKQVEVVPDAPAPAPPPQTPPRAPASTGMAPDVTAQAHPSGVRTAGYIVVASALTTLGASMALGLLAKGKNDDSNALCKNDACQNTEGVSLAHQASTLATASTVTFCASLVLAATGLTMVLVARGTSDGRSARLALTPSGDMRGAALDLAGAF
jgi:hypothetical protein